MHQNNRGGREWKCPTQTVEIAKEDGEMSYCAVIFFKDGKPEPGIEFRNAWGGHAFIWDALYNKYLKNPIKPYDSWLINFNKDQGQPLWDLARSHRLLECERAVHSATLDLAMIERKHFGRFANDLREFCALHRDESKVCHLLSWADLIERSEAEAVGFYGTSVSENPWLPYDEEKDEAVPYDLKTGERHFEVYDWQEQNEKERFGKKVVAGTEGKE